MEFWNYLINLLSLPASQNFLISIGAGVTWDVIKKFINLKKNKDSIDCLYYKVIAETFRLFYQTMQFEYDENIIMNAFLEQVRDANTKNTGDFSKAIIEKIIDCKLAPTDINIFTSIFIDTCAKNEFAPVARKILLEPLIHVDEKRDLDWMHEYMKDNCCKINFHIFNTIIPALTQIKTTLDKLVWIAVQRLIWEIVYNAQIHGNATLCRLKIDSYSISILDNGLKFNSLSLKNKKKTGGGGMAIRNIIEKYPEILISYSYNEENIFTIQFEKPTFDINEMSEIIVPSLIYISQIERLYPEGQFKYYFVDIANTLKNEEFFGASFSTLFRLVDREFGYLLKSTITSKIFIYFANIEDIVIKDLYNAFKEVISCFPDDIKNALILIPEGY